MIYASKSRISLTFPIVLFVTIAALCILLVPSLHISKRFPEFDSAGSSSPLNPCLNTATVALLENNPNIANLTHCWRADSSIGEFHLSTNLDSPVFKILLLGPHILRLPFNKTGLGIFKTHYDSLSSGTYTAELIMLFESFDFSTLYENIMRIPEPLTNYTFVVNAHLNQRAAKEKLPYCDGYVPLNGRWHLHNPQLIPSLSTAGYHGHYDYNNQTLDDPIFKNLVLDHKPRTDIPVQLEYVPDNCRVFDYSRNDAAVQRCAYNQTICMWGDSHVRSLHNTLSAWVSGNYTVVGKESAVSVFSRYYFKTFGGFNEDIESLLANGCKNVLFTFGQWPASFQGGYPWSPKQYEIYVEADIAWMAELRTKYPHVKMWWVTTDPLAYTSPTSRHQDWRYEPMLEEYNKRANQIAKRYQVPIIDTWNSGNALHLLTLDGSHYKGIVEWTYANLVLTAVCNKN